MSKKEKIEISECPFCGAEAWAKLAWKETKKRAAIYQCECRGCDAALYDDSIESAVKRWNERVTHAEMSSHLWRARERIRQFASSIVQLESEWDEKEAEVSGERKRFEEATKDIIKENDRLKKRLLNFTEKVERLARDMKRR